ncbi:MAG: carbohydrate kinase family protein [Clostridiales bacterium]|nr:carbohydrate kinase family protein [Clostridiales bacterium]
MDFVGGVGYANIDLIYSDLERLPGKGEEVFAKDFGMYLGGGIPATMINAGRLGIPSRVVTFIGEDYFSRFVKEELERHHMEVLNLYRGDGNPVIVSSTMVYSQERSFVSYHDELKITSELLEEAYRHLTGAKVVDMHTGFLEIYGKLQREGTIQVFDTGWEEGLSLEKYRDYLEIADYYMPNQKEALKITGETALEGAVRKLSQYFEHVIVKLDRKGCLLKDREGTRIIPPLEGIRSVDSTGAGDAFMSGFIYGLYHDYPVEQCIRFGNVTGGICVQSMGCLTSYVEEERLLDLSKSIGKSEYL